MKEQIRRGVFETNSSSTHSLTMCLKSDYDKWVNGEVMLYTGWGYGYPGDNCPKKNHFYTKEQVIEFEKSGYNPQSDNMDWNSEETEDYLREREWHTYGNYDNDYLEWFEDIFTTPSGETVVAFGQYGYDG